MMLLLHETYLPLFVGPGAGPGRVVQNQNVNIVKTRLVFPTIDGNAETLSGGFNDLFIGC